MSELSVPPTRVRAASAEIDPGARGPQGRRGEVRRRIRAIAREAFLADGYDGVTIRQIARSAGCDSAMIAYYFGSKHRLFSDCFDLPLDPAGEMLALITPDPSTAGERIVRHALELYEERMTAETMRALMRALITDVETSQRFRSYIRSQLLDKVTAYLGGGAKAAQQIELAMAQMYGVVAMRYVVRLEPLASMPRERVVAELAPIVQARLNRVFAGRL
ncbi:MAG TPA: TetR family transcriptional regulator [Arachnia sp.]|nr:TetR family transcriptional regulator [Arachnia sp.]